MWEKHACLVVMLSSAPRSTPLPPVSPEKAYFLLRTMQPLYTAPIMEPAPHSCPHCLGQDEKRLLFRKAGLSSPVNHANSHACSLSSSVSKAARGGEAGVFQDARSPEGSDVRWFTEPCRGHREVVTLLFLFLWVAQDSSHPVAVLAAVV